MSHPWIIDRIGLLMLVGCSITVFGHMALLRDSRMSWIQSPVSDLSREDTAVQHGIVLCVFGVTQGLLAKRVGDARSARLTHALRVLCLSAMILICALSWAFTLESRQLHTALLSVIASVAGVIMAILAKQDREKRSRGAHGWISVVSLTIWLGLIPVALYISDQHIGAYQRCVAVVYVVWLSALALAPATKQAPLSDAQVPFSGD